MPITAIVTQPATDSINAAYRPVVYQVAATKTDGTALPPIVYCDIYFNNQFYRSQSKTQPYLTTSTNSLWEFDIQDACKEWLRYELGANSGSQFIFQQRGSLSVQVRFRSSGIDMAGFTVPEGTAPVQGTGTIQPVAGTGTASNTTFVLPVALQHVDNQDLATHLNAFQSGQWGAGSYPLTHRPAGYQMAANDSDYFPFFYGGMDKVTSIALFYRTSPQANYTQSSATPTYSGYNPGANRNPYNVQYTIVDNGNGTQTVTATWSPLPAGAVAASFDYYDGSAWYNNTGSPFSPKTALQPVGSSVFRFRVFYPPNTLADEVYTLPVVAFQPGDARGAYLVPSGSANLSSLFPSVQFSTLYDYYLQILDSQGIPIATTLTFRLCRCDERIRVHFLNYLGNYDAVNFNRPSVNFDDDGDTYVKGAVYPLTKPEAVVNRWNVRANDTYDLFLKCKESDAAWLREFAASPRHYMEWIGIQGQPSSYLPLVKQRGQYKPIKNDGSEYQYEYAATFVLGNPVVTLRG